VPSQFSADGGAGAEALAHQVVELVEADAANQFSVLYPDEMGLWEKVTTIATRIYGAATVSATKAIRNRFAQLEEGGYGHFPVCMAKTQASLSHDAKIVGAPEGYDMPVREVRLSAGAEFVVVICGDIMTMPGLPKVPAAERIYINDQGDIEGLF